LTTLDKHLVLLSSSTDIFTNLAFEDLIYSNSTFTPKDGKILLIWRDKPCVVIGRHQNPWTEVCLDKCVSSGTAISRRNSGGGTVYHDMGNINMSFMTGRNDYNRRNNLAFISEFLKNSYSIRTCISPREDLVLDSSGEKISGTASKLASKNSYHHCTLLVGVNLNNMRNIIKKTIPSCLKSNATSSVRSSVKNLNSVCEAITSNELIERISDAFVNGDRERILTVDPNESVCPGLDEKIRLYRSWEWNFGKTPKFTLEKEFNNESYPFTVKIQVNHGIVTDFKVISEDMDNDLILDLKGVRFDQNAIQEKLLLWSLLEDDIIWSSSVCKAVDSIIMEVCSPS
jgi:lipoyltransferase 1